MYIPELESAEEAVQLEADSWRTAIGHVPSVAEIYRTWPEPEAKVPAPRLWRTCNLSRAWAAGLT